MKMAAGRLVSDDIKVNTPRLAAMAAKPGNTSEDVLGGGSWSGGWNITPWWGVQGSKNSSGYTAGYSYGVPGISGAWTYSGCKHVGG
jgi:hypothetical protein